MFNHHDIKRDSCMLHGPLAHHGYDWWWHSFTAPLRWRRTCLSWDSFRRTWPQERNLPILW